MFLNQKRLQERYESILPALKNGMPIRLNIIKLPEKNRGTSLIVICGEMVAKLATNDDKKIYSTGIVPII